MYLVWTRNQSRRAQMQYYGRLYGGLEAATATPLGIDPAAQIFEPATLPYNVIRSGVNTLVAKVAKNRPTPMYLPVGADPITHKKVKLLNQFVGGLFHKHRAHKHGYIATRDAALYGTGQLLVQRAFDRISIQQIFPWEVYVDPVDARYGEPRSLYLVRYLDKDHLKYTYCRNKDEDQNEENEYMIDSAPVLDEAFFPIQDVFAVATRCTVIEAWHLPSGPGAKDGVHTVCLLDHTLLDEPYHREEFPIVKLVKDAPLAGFWGMGLGDEISGFQDEINLMTERVQYAHRIVGGQVWLVPDGSGMLDTDFNDEIGVVLRYQGGPAMAPVAVNPEPVHQYTYEYFKELPQTAYGFAGISSMSVQSQKPPGVTAALALQTLDDIETDRFALFERAHEEFYVDLGRHMLFQVREIAEKYGDFEVLSTERSTADKICWSDIDVQEDSYVVQSWPVSLLPKTPAAKLQRVLELSMNGIFDKPQVLKMLGLPDTDSEERLMLAPRDVVDVQIACMLGHPDPAGVGFQSPEKYQDLAYALSRAQAYYDRLRADSTEKGIQDDPAVSRRLYALANYMDRAKALIDDAQSELVAKMAAAQAAPALGAGAPVTGAVPGPTTPMSATPAPPMQAPAPQ